METEWRCPLTQSKVSICKALLTSSTFGAYATSFCSPVPALKNLNTRNCGLADFASKMSSAFSRIFALNSLLSWRQRCKPMLDFSFIRHSIEFLGIGILFFRTFRYNRGNVSEVSRFSWDADNSKLELTGEETGRNENCRRAAEKCHVKRQICGWWRVRSTRKPWALPRSSYILCTPSVRTSVWRGGVFANSGETLMRKFFAWAFLYTNRARSVAIACCRPSRNSKT